MSNARKNGLSEIKLILGFDFLTNNIVCVFMCNCNMKMVCLMVHHMTACDICGSYNDKELVN